ncbi:pseudouridine synthase [Allofranklinella schreckenbergeri]|uniref:Dual-specificity RNA pseudouridine synthase RluF n=1 Tax=Allofranklinella schreckenbergeri TaxID=1076744 RepID=A0A3M6PZP7_9BURK|nr:pseudouridine synthase [Allofranklinella schreckenbergeri]
MSESSPPKRQTLSLPPKDARAESAAGRQPRRAALRPGPGGKRLRKGAEATNPGGLKQGPNSGQKPGNGGAARRQSANGAGRAAFTRSAASSAQPASGRAPASGSPAGRTAKPKRPAGAASAGARSGARTGSSAARPAPTSGPNARTGAARHRAGDARGRPAQPFAASSRPPQHQGDRPQAQRQARRFETAAAPTQPPTPRPIGRANRANRADSGASAPHSTASHTPLPPQQAQGVRLNKYLADAQWCSRREADEWVEKGWVRINGHPAQMGQRVLPGDVVDVAELARARQARRATIVLHKPVGYVSGQAEDGHTPALRLITHANQWMPAHGGRRGAPASLKGFAPAGRLDIDSTGLLLLTQDGRLARRIIGEDSTIEKEYLVRVSWRSPTGEEVSENVQAAFPAEGLQRLRHGLELDGKALLPAQVDWQNPEQLRFVLREGKKRQIRRMCALVGLHVTALKRVRIGRLPLGQLPQGQWRYLADDEAI